jgi:hypothetical protein
MKELIRKFIGSLDNKEEGFSARKLTAFVMVILVIIIDIKWLNSQQWIYISEILGLHFMFILTLLGLATWQKVQDKKIEAQKPTEP